MQYTEQGMSEPGSFHYSVSHSESRTSSRDISFEDKVRNHSLAFSEDKELLLNLEHDQMLYSGYDRQSQAFDNELIDKFDYLKCPCHDTSELHDWAITNNPNGSLTIGGLRSPCPNSRYFVDNVDRVGRVIYSFDQTFTTECEKEMYYVEIMVGRLSMMDYVIALDAVKSCRITKLLSLL